jgi:hypothetical protein
MCFLFDASLFASSLDIMYGYGVVVGKMSVHTVHWNQLLDNERNKLISDDSSNRFVFTTTLGILHELFEKNSA